MRLTHVQHAKGRSPRAVPVNPLPQVLTELDRMPALEPPLPRPSSGVLGSRGMLPPKVDVGQPYAVIGPEDGQ